MNYTNKMRNEFKKIDCNKIIVAKDFYEEHFKNENENLFYKILERFCKNNTLKRIGKGIYIKPKITKYGEIPISEDTIIDFYTRNNEGLCVGYCLYNNKGITTQTPNKINVLSNRVYEKEKNIRNVNIKKINFKLNEERKKSIEILEILENSNNIEDINYNELIKLINNYINNYNEKETMYVLNNIKYKKSTIASLKYYLDKNKIKNSLGVLLSSLSKYKIVGKV